MTFVSWSVGASFIKTSPAETTCKKTCLVFLPWFHNAFWKSMYYCDGSTISTQQLFKIFWNFEILRFSKLFWNLKFCFSRKFKIFWNFEIFKISAKLFWNFGQSKTLAKLFWNFAISKCQNIFDIFTCTLHSPCPRTLSKGPSSLLNRISPEL